MASAISGVSASLQQQYASAINTAQTQGAKVDRDGDHDGSKPGEVETKAAPKPTSETLGNFINTTA